MKENETQPPDNRGFVEHWRRVGPKLEAIRREELRNFRHEDHVEEIDSLLEIGLQFDVPRPMTGLVELERLLKKRYEQTGQ